MSKSQDFIDEIQREAVATEKSLQRIPVEQFGYSPHEKSKNIKDLGQHLAELSGMAAAIAAHDELDLAQMAHTEIHTPEDLVNLFNEGRQQSVKALENMNDEDFDRLWTLKYGDQEIMHGKKGEMIRKMALSHQYHHRAQLGVYLRMLNQPVPATYGPSADEQ